MADLTIRAATREDLPALTAIYNHYVVNTAITFDIDPYTVEQRVPWFEQFAGSGRHRLFVALEAGTLVGHDRGRQRPGPIGGEVDYTDALERRRRGAHITPISASVTRAAAG